ncbi:glycosyltransferase family 4 protein [Aquisalimonas sp.]|uniref:glycosyltransferase family 4 protein n=1 Tax=Aquisalimonas sp. TaxID=1872621 RepID=UPI0025BADC2F|nr:MraY family glycosyltransferase [Aquisalimonas sp.]
MQSLFATVTALIISLIVIPVMIRLAPALDMLDQPNARKVHLRPMPRVGGWGITLGAMIAVLLWQPPSAESAAFVVGALILLLGGTWDDQADLPPLAKLALQCAAAIPVVSYAGLAMDTAPLFGDWALHSALALPLTVLGLMTCINATNTSDGLDGLAAGVTLLSFFGILYLAYALGITEVLLITAACIGGLAGFLRYNTYPARIFMGDSGSQFLGFAVGFLGLALVHAAPGQVSPWLLLLLVGLPTADLGIVMIRRIINRQPPFHPDKTHLHHRLIAVGFTHNQSVITIYAAQASFVFFGVALLPSQEWTILLVYALHLIVVYGFVYLAEQTVVVQPPGNNRKRASSPRPVRPVLVWAPRVALELLIPVILVTLAALATNVPRDFALFAAALLALLVPRLFRTGMPPSLLTRVPVFMTVTAVLYLYTEYPPFESGLAQATEMAGMAAVALLAVGAVRSSPMRRQREFRISALDYLLLILAALTFVALLTSPLEINPLFMIYAAILLYGSELLLVERRERWDWLLLAVAMAALLIVFRGLAL